MTREVGLERERDALRAVTDAMGRVYVHAEGSDEEDAALLEAERAYNALPAHLRHSVADRARSSVVQERDDLRTKLATAQRDLDAAHAAREVTEARAAECDAFERVNVAWRSVVEAAIAVETVKIPCVFTEPIPSEDRLARHAEAVCALERAVRALPPEARPS